ncbi:MAG: TetR/AcrR family transcriptional regulator [Acutalibacteraceae bacterium]
MEKKGNQRIALTKRLLKESLSKLMKDKYIHNITVKELCEISGINRSTFYNHYGCPADVLREIELEFIDDLEKIYMNKYPDDNRDICKRTEALFTYLTEHYELAKLLFRDGDTDSEFPSLLFNAAHVTEIYEQTLSDVSDSYFKLLLTTFFTNGTYHVIRKWLLDDIPKTPQEMGELVNLFINQLRIQSENM